MFASQKAAKSEKTSKTKQKTQKNNQKKTTKKQKQKEKFNMNNIQKIDALANKADGFLQIEKSILLNAIVRNEINGNLKEYLLNELVPPRLLKKIDFTAKKRPTEKEIIKRCLKVAKSDTKIGKILRDSLERDEEMTRSIERDAMTRIKHRIEKRKYDDTYFDKNKRNIEIIELKHFIEKLFSEIVHTRPDFEMPKVKQAIGYFFNSHGFSKAELQNLIPELSKGNTAAVITKGERNYNDGNPMVIELFNIIKEKWENRNGTK